MDDRAEIGLRSAENLRRQLCIAGQKGVAHRRGRQLVALRIGLAGQDIGGETELLAESNQVLCMAAAAFAELEIESG